MKIINKIQTIIFLHKINKWSLILGGLLITTFYSCKPKFYETPSPGVPSAGSVSLAEYVAVGGSIEAGYMDGALYPEGESNSYPNLLALAIKQVNPSLPWVQPVVNSPSGNGWQFNNAGKNGRYIFTNPACTTINLVRDTTDGENTLQPFQGAKSSFTNLGVPYLPVTNINSATVPGAVNKSTTPLPYFDNLVNAGSLGIASEAKQRKPTFFTVFTGYEDVLKIAKGGIVTSTTLVPTTATFQQEISDLLDSLLATAGSKGVIATIPYVDLFPVITNNNRRLTSTSDPARNPVTFPSQAYADSLSNLVGVPGLFSGAPANKNDFAIQTGSGGAIRQLSTSKDFILRSNLLDSVGFGGIDPQATRACTPNNTPRTGKGFNKAIADVDVLDASEVTALRAQIDAYNTAIKNVVALKNASGTRVAIVDLNSFYTTLTDPLYGIRYGASVIRANHPSLGPDFGGFYSLDRAYPNPKGQSLLANEFIKVINSTWGANLIQYNPDNYRANTIPQ